MFAHQYGVTCEKCHSVIPHLNAFGAAFLANGYRIPGVRPSRAVPVAAKVNLVDSSENQGSGSNGAGLPKAIVDEVELFTAGALGSRASYLVEQYPVNGGTPGLLRDAWVMERVNPWNARIPLFLQLGSFTLPLPVDPETFWDTYQGYTLFEQTVGNNPFNFFDPKVGAHLSVGDALRGLNVQVFAGPGHERQSGLSSFGTDFMEYAQDNLGPYSFSLYRYAGSRPLGSAIVDRFQRTGFGFTFDQWGRLASETVLQTGWDSNCGVGAGSCASSGGFTQLRYEFTPKLYALGRYEGTNAPSGGFTRDGVLLVGYGLSEHSRITAEDAIQHLPQTKHTLNMQLTVAY